MKTYSIRVSEETHTQFFSIKNKLRDVRKRFVYSDEVLHELLNVYYASTPYSTNWASDRIKQDMYQLEEKT